MESPLHIPHLENDRSDAAFVRASLETGGYRPGECPRIIQRRSGRVGAEGIVNCGATFFQS